MTEHEVEEPWQRIQRERRLREDEAEMRRIEMDDMLDRMLEERVKTA